MRTRIQTMRAAGVSRPVDRRRVRPNWGAYAAPPACRSVLVLLIWCVLLVAPVAAQSTQDAIEQTLPRVVKIFGAGGFRGLPPYSTGFLISPEGHVVTVWNHVLDADEVTAVLDDGRRFPAKVVNAEPQLDLAVLKLQAEGLNLPHFDLDNLGTAAPGMRVLAFSNMFKVATGDEPVSVLHGVVSAQTALTFRRGAFEFPYKGPVYVVDAITNNAGGEGGVITTRDGKLLAMIGRELRNAESNTWINYGIPVSELKETIEQILSGDFRAREQQPEDDENPNRYRPLDFGLVMVPDVVYRTPAYIDAVAPGSAAEGAGLQRDDLIVFVNDRIVHSVRSLKQELGRLQAGDLLRIVVRRGNALVTVEMPVERKEEKM